MHDQLEAFRRDQAWGALEGEAGQDLVPGFGAQLAELMDSCIQGARRAGRGGRGVAGLGAGAQGEGRVCGSVACTAVPPTAPRCQPTAAARLAWVCVRHTAGAELG